MPIDGKLIVVTLPQRLTAREARDFLQRTDVLLQTDQPQLVFDFSQVRELDSAGVEVLLESLERVIQRDGDLKLAAIPAEIAVVLEMTCVDRLFEIFDETADAAGAFQAFSADAQRCLDSPPQANAETQRGDTSEDVKMTG
jgi:anti-sigma B factor antagonist